jgi:hypothetical protein
MRIVTRALSFAGAHCGAGALGVCSGVKGSAVLIPHSGDARPVLPAYFKFRLRHRQRMLSVLDWLICLFHAFEHWRDPWQIPAQRRDRCVIICICLRPQVRHPTSHVDDESAVSLIGAKNLLSERR